MSLNAITHSWNVLRGSQTNNTYSDLSLSTVRGETINCHKVVICNVSDKVRGALEKKDTNNLVIRNVTYSGLKNVINFIYYGKVEISDAEQLIDFADTFTILQINLGPKIASTVRNIIMSNDAREGFKKKLIIFMEFSMEGYPHPPPAPLPWKIINFFPTIF